MLGVALWTKLERRYCLISTLTSAYGLYADVSAVHFL